MDGRQPEFPQSGLSSPYAPYSGHQSEASSADQASAVQYPPNQDYKPQNFSASATPNPEYGLPQSARSGSFPEYIQRPYPDGQQNRYPTSAQGGHAPMAQTSSPSHSTPNGHHSHGHTPSNPKSNGDVPIDPSIQQSSPTYPPSHNYSPYPPQHEMQPQYAGQPMAYGRPDWAGQYQQPMYPHSPATTGGAPPGMVAHTVPRPPAVGVARWPRDINITTDLFTGRASTIDGVFIRTNPGCATTQASATSLRRDRKDVQVWVEWLREGVRHAEPPKCACDDARTRAEAHT